ncbi:hypothetical protein SAMN05421644_1781 [Allochromatium warmingii]|uniref:Uncharacterized protein n=1 Tax=Allochromatium warmingii TaxID=61595 RepID=A0A1H3K743_ALLWA|nr:hypothetical protein SAMN05421644_1781 [Allochromatium warmingii]
MTPNKKNHAKHAAITIISKNYFAYALTLEESYRKYTKLI